MSDIDLIKHYRVGILGQVPVYLCREDGCWIGKQMERQPSSTARKNALCIGGGDGEHPSLVINDPPSCVAVYLRHAGIERRDIVRRSARRTNEYMVYCDGMTRLQWERRFQREYAIWKSTMSFDRWIATIVGEFTYFMLHDLYPEIRTWRKYAKELYPYLHVLCIPWDTYGGNGIDYFEVKKRKPNKGVVLTGDPLRGSPAAHP